MAVTIVVSEQLFLQLIIAIVLTELPAACKKFATEFSDSIFGWKKLGFCQQFLYLRSSGKVYFKIFT